MRSALIAGMASIVLLGCAAQSHVIVGKVRPPISPDQVKIYLEPPKAFERIAIIDASSQSSLAFTQQQKIQRLKEEAAKVGATAFSSRDRAASQSDLSVPVSEPPRQPGTRLMARASEDPIGSMNTVGDTCNSAPSPCGP